MMIVSRLLLALCATLWLTTWSAPVVAGSACVEGDCGQPEPEEPEPPGPKPTPEEEPPPHPPPPPPPPIPRGQGNDAGGGNMAPASGSATAPSGAPEYVLAGAADAVTAATAIVVAAGGEVLRQDRLASIGVSMAVLDLKRQIAADDLRRILRDRGVKVTLSRNSTYQMAEGPRIYAGALVGVDIAKPCPLAAAVTIGLVDGPVDTNSAALVGLEILAHSVLEEGEKPASVDHATALAGLIASPGSGTFPPGFAPGAKLLSAVAFANRNGRNLAQMDRIAAALDWLAAQGAEIINLSLTGPPNDTLAYILHNFADSGLILIASVGNDGTDHVSFPASDPNVLGVSAIDAAGRLYPNANKGPEVDFVAPGVDLLVDEGERRTYRSGTSYASAVATGVIAQLFARGDGSAEDIVASLRTSAIDMGASGFDSRFGWGLLQLTGCSG